MKTTLSTKGQIVLPAEFREQDQIAPGQQFEVERLQAGEYLLRKLVVEGEGNVLDWLKSCPETDWFTPIDSESTDSL
ncbi:AbrB/MazE/SpoVT family DNA-binding domain-containing protein [Bythopirellula polymerisocia]|uniref:SpoVT-AbrB domain-containing protein n=1 Tax=Bythopirellula polymerisocia TaxID=2528003 RepID=A0A5C6D4D1_9BACT|nr:AbrB/MazE/SpoVT family DNA-binding domain-containing protein [Bythopirellula polymerisocia]TWU29709.1 hypothetical protein Pla144_04880 [Bythopirellula polymerisocia]